MGTIIRALHFPLVRTPVFFALAASACLSGSLARAGELTPVTFVAAGSPQSAVGRLNNGTGGYCTAVLVGADTAVTAAHCLYNARTKRWLKADSLHLLLGYDRGAYGFHTLVADYRVGPFDPANRSETAAADWAVLELAQSAPASFSRLTRTRGRSENRIFQVTGFGSPRNYVLSATGDCAATEAGNLLFSACATAPGLSGAPLIEQSTGELLGIQIGYHLTDGKKVMVAVPASAWGR